MDLILPFKIGEFPEAKSFMKGFRGAWFRCKVNDMRVTKSGHLEFYLEYIDYPDEGNSSTDEDMTSDDNKEEEQESSKSASDTSQDAPGYSNLKPSSGTNGNPKLNNQTNTIVTSMEKSRPSSTSRSSYCSHGTQATTVGKRKGTRGSRKRRASPTHLVSAQYPCT